MQIYPAIDLLNKQCVRLYQGQFDQSTLYNENPLSVAKDYQQQGATWLHVVDLDAAKQNGNHHYEIIAEICQHTQLKLQVGGGIRSIDDITTLLSLGVNRVIIGSLAVKQPKLVQQWLKHFGREKIVVAVDVLLSENQQPYIATHGWQQNSEVILWQLLTDFQTSGLTHILCTDITRDGTLQGPNIELYQQCQEKFPQYALQASGGISQLSDLTLLRQNQLAGAVIGKALYEKRFELRTCLHTAI